MKKLLSITLTISILLFTVSTTFAKTNDVSVYIDGTKIEFDVPPQLIGGRTMVPLRMIFESLGAVVEWDGKTSTVTAYNEFYLVKATIGNNIMTVNGIEKQIDVPPMIVNSRTLVPARFVAEAFNCDVEWDANTKTVYITSGFDDYSQIEKPSLPNNNNNNNISIAYYNNTHIPTYTSVTGRNLSYNMPTSDGEMVYVYPYDRSSADAYSDYLIHHNWWQTNEGNDADGTFCFYQNNQYREKVCVAIDVEMGELQIISLTNFPEETNNNSNSNSSTQNNNTQYYPGTHIPTYSSITRYNIHDTYIADNGETMFMYVYNENAVDTYIDTLNKKGWKTSHSELNNYGNYKFILTNNTYKEQVHILVSFGDKLVCIMTETDLLECYPGTNIPTYTSITGDELIETSYTSNDIIIYSYPEDEVSLTNYLDFIGNNGWDVEVIEGNDNSYCNVIFTSQRASNESFMMSVEFAYGEIWIYVNE